MKPANMTNSPWAKLMASVALYTSTKPSAISVYISPIITPLVISTSVNCQSRSSMGWFHQRRRRFVGAVDRHVRPNRRFASIFVGDVGDELDVALAAVERLDDRIVFLGDVAPPDLAGAGDLVVVGVELLVQQQEAPDPRRRRQAGVALADLVANQLPHLRVGAQILERGVADAAALRPLADGLGIDGDHRRDERPIMAEGDGFVDERTEFEFVLQELWREGRTVAELAHFLGAIDDDEVPARIDEAGIARPQPAVGGQRVRARLCLLVIALEHAGGADQHLAALVDPDADAGASPADRIGIGLGIRLQRSHAAQLGRAVDLLQVDAEGAEETKLVGSERRPAGISPAHAAQSQLIANRPIDQPLAP